MVCGFSCCLAHSTLLITRLPFSSSDSAFSIPFLSLLLPLFSLPFSLSFSSGVPGSMSEVAKSTKKKRRKKLAGGRTEKGRCQLTSLEHEMYEWARKGFLPSGPAGFKPTSGSLKRWWPITVSLKSGLALCTSYGTATTGTGLDLGLWVE